MKVALVSSYTHPVALGLRYVSSYLKAAGHEVEVLFMCSSRKRAEGDWSPAVLDAFVEHCRHADLIGISLMTNTFFRACALTETLRKAGIKAPILWGGTHPTVAPDECLEVADIICVGEGEEPTLQLLEHMEAGRSPLEVPSLCFRAGGPFGNQDTVRNPAAWLEQDLDDYPFPDYELHTHWVVEGSQLVAARPENLRGTLHRLRVASTRGCPFACAFCNNTALRNIYRGKGRWVRTRSNENVIQEIERAWSCFPTIEAVNVVDDLFFVRGEEEIEDFVEKYKARVNLPIELDAFPNTLTERKVAAIARLPIALISMGIQSTSQDTLKNIYKRPTAVKDILACMDLFTKYRLRAEYHYIVSNPYEPDANVIETMRFAATHHRGPAVLRIFPLMFYPGTPLCERARADGLIGPRDEVAYKHMYSSHNQFAGHDYLCTWLRVVLHMRNVGIPRWICHRLIDVVISRPARFLLDHKSFSPAAQAIYFVLRKAYMTLLYQPFIRPFRYLRRKPTYAELHPEDEVSLPRNNMAVADKTISGRKAPALSSPRAQPIKSWILPRENLHAWRRRALLL
ncbi:MAG TPA: radical SAM protein [Phycisphaerae bacterium]|nr:radical SAM protein [Phycisphaerae bacterium]